MFRRKIVTKIYCAIIAGSMLWSAPCFAGPQIPGFYGKLPNLTPPVATAVPQLKGIVQGVTNVVHDQAQNKLTVNQDKDKAILDWNSFDIGQDAWTHFNQQGNRDWAALNRIHDRNPSQIYGKLTADGKVYLINQNGILFGPSSRVNVHSLTASSLNIKDDDFINGALNFMAEDYAGLGGTKHLSSLVSNHGVIETDELGEVFLLAPTVENNGTIISSVGQVGLAAGTEVSLYRDSNLDPLRSGLFVHVKAGAGEATNFENGWILADAGLAGMYGRVVNQEGVIRAVTAIKKKGQVELWASDKVSTGPKSITSTMVSDSTERVHESFELQPGEIRIQGLRPGFDVTTRRYDPVKVLEHRGIMEAPSGLIHIRAEDRVYLESGSKIDVSGRWVDSPADGNVVETQLNSVELRDDYGQKEGLLKGQKVKFDAYLGSAVGDVSGALTSKEVTALEQATKGGTITILGPLEEGQGLGEIVIRNDAHISFAGGGIRYAPGQMETTTLKAGNQIYDISEAPQYMVYDGVMGLHQSFHERFGIMEEFWGLYSGGANDIRNFRGERVEGKDAGTLQLMAKRIVLDGSLDGSVLKGPFQTQDEEPMDEQGNQEAKGHTEPKAGTLELGVADPDGDPSLIDYYLHEVVVRPHVDPLPPTFKPDDKLPGTGAEALRTYLSSQTLSAANLGSLKIYSNTRFVTEKDSVLSLRPGTELAVTARAIEHRGEISSPGGSLTLIVRDNITTGAIPVTGDGRAFLATGSKLVTAGEKVDNFETVRTGGGLLNSGHLDGGAVSITVQGSPGEGIVVSRGSLIDVSGGYLIDEKGTVTGGNAGSLNIAMKSDGKGALILDGDLKGHSIPGKRGGSLSLLAKRISVEPTAPPPLELEIDSPIPVGLRETFVLAQNRLDPTGFTNIELLANFELGVEPGVRLFPSSAKLIQPVGMARQESSLSVHNNVYGMRLDNGGIVTVDPEFMGPSSITLKAGLDEGLSTTGANDSSMLDIGSQALIGVGPAGSIKMEAPGVRVAGRLDAPAGKIDVKATGPNMDLTLLDGAVLSAKGYNRPDSKPVIKGYPVGYTPVAAGTIKLESSQGSLLLQEGSQVDVSGSEPVKAYMKTAANKATPLNGDDEVQLSVPGLGGYSSGDGAVYSGVESFMVAGDPGSVSLTFFKDLELKGTLEAYGRMQGLRGGSLSLNKKDSTQGLVISSESVDRFKSQGFDALTLKSKRSIGFSGSAVAVAMGRSLTLDAPEIQVPIGFEGQSVSLSAPWVSLLNTPGKYDTNDNPYGLIPGAATSGTGAFTATGDWIDVKGSTVLSGFGDVSLTALNDIRVSDEVYGDTSSSGGYRWEGKLKVPGNISFRAERIYPTTLSEFTFKAPDTGKVSILPGSEAEKNPVYSAGGGLTIEAGTIDHQGYLAAPLGRIQLKTPPASGKVYLAKDSVTTVAGIAPVKYGDLEGEFWQVPDRASAGGATVKKDITAVPDKSVEISGKEVTVQEGALVDLSHGGSIYTHQFVSSPQGSESPLRKEGRYVILPDKSVVLPGATRLVHKDAEGDGKIDKNSDGTFFDYEESLAAIYLEGAPGLPAGTYSLLPEEFAFLPGAMILTDLSKTGQSYVLGQTRSLEGYPVTAGYAVIQGTDVKSSKPKGYSVRPTEDVLKEGFFTVLSLAGGDAGTLSITGDTTVLDGTFRIKALPGFQKGKITLAGKRIELREVAGIPESDKLLLQPSFFEEMDLREIVLGDLTRTDVIEMKGSTALKAERISLEARDEVILRSGAKVEALSETGGGVASLVAQGGAGFKGKVTLEPNSLVHASDEVVLDLKTIDYRGEIQVDNGAIALGSKEIFFVPKGKYDQIPANPDGFYIKDSDWEKFKLFETITVRSENSISFLDDFTLEAAGMLSLDASRISWKGGNDPGDDVLVSAPIVGLLNSGANTPLDPDTGLPKPGMTILAETGTLKLSGSEVRGGRGDVLLDGFSRMDILSQGDAVFQGEGSLTTQGDFKITAARVTTSNDLDAAGNYQVVDFSVNAGTGAIAIHSNGGLRDTGLTPGGNLSLMGRRIDITGLIEVSSARLSLNATGSGADGVSLTGTARIRNLGSEYGPGGSVELRSDLGKVELATGSIIDVSAGAQGDAGVVSLLAPEGGVSVDGTLLGLSSGGQGGSLAMDTKRISDFSSLNAVLTAGGFTQTIDLRSREGNMAIGLGQRVVSREFRLAVDQGNLSVYGEIDASGAQGGGRVELYAGNLLYLYPEARIYAKGTNLGAPGGEVFLGTSSLGTNTGHVAMLQGSLIDVSGGEGGTGGTVNIRAPRFESGGLKEVFVLPFGTIAGAESVFVEAFKVYSFTGNKTIASADFSTETSEGWWKEAYDFMKSASAIETRLLASMTKQGWTDSQLHLLPGIEIRSRGDITVADPWDLSPKQEALYYYDESQGGWLNSGVVGPNLFAASSEGVYQSGWHFGLEPGVLTLRAQGNLNLQNRIVDNVHPSFLPGGPDSYNNILIPSEGEFKPFDIRLLVEGIPVNPGSTGRDSWAFNLVAGADLSSADPSAVVRGTGKLTISDDRTLGGRPPKDVKTYVYTESAPIRFASGGDTELGKNVLLTGTEWWALSAPFKIATFDGSYIQGRVDGKLMVNGGALLSGTGDIDLFVGKDLLLGRSGMHAAIATLGLQSGDKTYERSGGGDIRLRVKGQVATVSEKTTTQVALTDVPWDFGYKIRQRNTVKVTLSGTPVSGSTWIITVDETAYAHNVVEGEDLAAVQTALAAAINSASGYDAGVNGKDIEIVKVSGGTIDVKTTLPEDASSAVQVLDHVAYDWGPSFPTASAPGIQTKASSFTRGIAAMGGGNVELYVGGDFRGVAGSFGNALFSRAYPLQDPAVLGGEGDLRLYAGGDVAGRFLVTAGDGEIHAMGTLGGADMMSALVLEGFDAQFRATAQGDLHLGGMVNPTIVEANYGSSVGTPRLMYTEGSSLSLASAYGDILLYGDSPFHSVGNELIMPPTLTAEAKTGDIHILKSFILASSSKGNLKLIAGGDILGRVTSTQNVRTGLSLSDMSPSKLYGHLSEGLNISDSDLDLIHAKDKAAIQVQAGEDGDIRDLEFAFPKKAEVSAGKDIVNVYLHGQNLVSEDTTIVSAGGNVVFPILGLVNLKTGFEVGGPGSFVVHAGGNIDLGDAHLGIRTIGGTLHSPLGRKGSDLFLIAGSGERPAVEDIKESFIRLKDGIKEYTTLLASGKVDEAAASLAKTREEVFGTLHVMPDSAGGDVLMLNSSISTLQGKDDLFILANGKIDVGRTTFFQDESDRQSTGIFTAGGGGINILTRSDVNVNESRVMSFLGGDITIWSDQGVINAGRGSKTTVSASPPKPVWAEPGPDGKVDTADDVYNLVFSPPAVGSGIRTLTFDPDGTEGPTKEPDAGDVFLYGLVIDAGEAGIAGKNLFLGSTTVLNAQNITFSGTAVGVPVASTGAVGIGALAGVSSLTEVGKMTEQAAGMASSRAEAAQQAAKLSEDLVAKWLDVKVIGFE